MTGPELTLVYTIFFFDEALFKFVQRAPFVDLVEVATYLTSIPHIVPN